MNRLSRMSMAALLVVGVLAATGTADAKRGPSAVIVCVDSSSGVVSRVASTRVCLGKLQSWTASQPAPLLCWDASSLEPQNRSRLISVKPLSGCVAPLRSVPVRKVVLLCADRVSGVLRWPVTGVCAFGNQDTRVRLAAAQSVAPSTTTIPSTTSTSTTSTSTTSTSTTSTSTSTTSTTVAVRTQTLDQTYAGFGNGCRSVSATSTMGQIFRAGLSGPLSRVSLAINDNRTVTNFVASIYASNGTGVIGPALASKSILGTAVPAYSGCDSSLPSALVHVDFATPAVLVSGNQYIIVLTTADERTDDGGGEYGWNLSTATSGGVESPFSSPSANPDGFVFRTYVDI